MSSPAFVPPAHGNLLPGQMRFVQDVTSFCRDLMPELSIEQAYRAESDGQTGCCGYYQIQTSGGERLFAKVKPPQRAERERRAAEISTWLSHQGASTLPFRYPPTHGPEGEQIFIYPWLESRFFDDSDTQVQNLGRALALLHNQLAAFPMGDEDWPPLVDSWKAQLELVPSATFALEYQASLSAVEPLFCDQGGCLAHNDLHRANVLFGIHDDLPTFLDFEDMVGVRSCVLVDVAAVIERFCFWPEVDGRKARLLLVQYLAFAERPMTLNAAELVHVGLCRCFHSLAILHAVAEPENPGWCLEVSKFENLIQCWKRWEGALGRALAQI